MPLQNYIRMTFSGLRSQTSSVAPGTAGHPALLPHNQKCHAPTACRPHDTCGSLRVAVQKLYIDTRRNAGSIALKKELARHGDEAQQALDNDHNAMTMSTNAPRPGRQRRAT